MKKQILIGLLLAFGFQQATAMGALTEKVKSTVNMQVFKRDVVKFAQVIKSMPKESKIAFLSSVLIANLGMDYITMAHNDWCLPNLLEAYSAFIAKMVYEQCGPDYILCLRDSLPEKDLRAIEQLCKECEAVEVSAEDFSKTKSFIVSRNNLAVRQIIHNDIKFKIPSHNAALASCKLQTLALDSDYKFDYKLIQSYSRFNHALHTCSDSVLNVMCLLVFGLLVHSLNNSENPLGNANAVGYALLWLLYGMMIDYVNVSFIMSR